MHPVPPVFTSVPGFPARLARCGPMVLRAVLIGAAALLAYALFSALDDGAAKADDGRLRDLTTTNRTDADGGVVGGLLGTAMDRLAVAPPVARRAPAVVGPPDAVAGSRSEPRLRRAASDRPRLPEASASPGVGVLPPTEAGRTVRDAAATVVERARSHDRLPRPSRPRDPAAPPADAAPDVVSDVVALVPEVVEAVPSVVETVPAVVGAVPDLLGVIPRVVELLPETVPGVVEVLPEVIGGHPEGSPPDSPSDPVTPSDPLRPLWPIGPSTMSPPAQATASGSAVVGSPTGALTFPVGSHPNAVSWHSPSTVLAASVRADLAGHGPAPGQPPTNKPLLGAHQAAGGTAGGFAYPYAMPVATVAAVDYRLLYTRVVGQIIRAGSVPGVPALPG